jgi:hypothetical protein
MFVPSLAHAVDEDRTIVLLLKNVPGAPTPSQIVDYTNTWPHAANPPLQAFNAIDPVASGYLLPDRATGDFLAWLQVNPYSARRKLEDAMLMLFPSPADIPTALAALQADPYVESADVPLQGTSIRPQSVTPASISQGSQRMELNTAGLT